MKTLMNDFAFNVFTFQSPTFCLLEREISLFYACRNGLAGLNSGNCIVMYNFRAFLRNSFEVMEQQPLSNRLSYVLAVMPGTSMKPLATFLHMSMTILCRTRLA